jgi:methyl-accepting chemotaxis protein
MDEIVSLVGSVADMVDRIAVAMEQQSSMTNEVSHNMENIAFVTRQLRDSSSEMTVTSGDLTSVAVRLDQAIRWFHT